MKILVALLVALLFIAECRADLDTASEKAAVGGFYAALFVVLVLVFIYLRLAVRIVRHAEVMIIERFGRYRTTLKPGLHFLWPFVDKPRTIHWRSVVVGSGSTSLQNISFQTERIDMREHVIDFGRQHVITKDTVLIDIDALVYYQITDPELAVFKIQNLPDAVELLTQTTLRNIIAHMTLDDTFSSRDLINARLKESTKLDAERWGISIKHVEIMNIFPPREIQGAMEQQIREERERRSTVLIADGERESAVTRSQGTRARIVLEAEGTKTALIQRAKGKAEAKLLMANAEAESIKAIRAAIESVGMSSIRATDYLVSLQYLASLSTMTSAKRNSEVVLVPSMSLDEAGELTRVARKAQGDELGELSRKKAQGVR